jgi:aubergine-like protein
VVDIAPYIKNSLEFFKTKNTFYPEMVIIYRKGKSEEETTNVINQETKGVESLFNEYKEKSKIDIQYIFCSYNTRSSLRAFQGTSGGYMNPRMPLIIDDPKIISKTEQSGLCYEFFLKPQNQTIGTSNFTHYKVLSIPPNINHLNFAEFTLCQCFGFFGFNGGIRLPAISQYAKRAAERYALTKQKPAESISSLKYAY